MKFSDIKQELLTTFQEAIDEFVASAEAAEARQEDPVSICSVEISFVGLSKPQIEPGVRNLNVTKKVPA